jgi:hypothetical protein
MDLAMVKQQQGKTLRQYMRCFFDKRMTIVDLTDKEVIDLFQDGVYTVAPSETSVTAARVPSPSSRT